MDSIVSSVIANSEAEVVYLPSEPEIVYKESEPEIIYIESEPEIVYIEKEGDSTNAAECEPEVIYIEKEAEQCIKVEEEEIDYFTDIFSQEFTIYGLPDKYSIGEI